MRAYRRWLVIGSAALVASGACGLVGQPASAQTSSATAAAPAAATSVQYPFAYAVNGAANTVTRVGLGFGVLGRPITVGTNPVAVAITPNGQVAYVVNKGSNTVTPVYTAFGIAGAAIPVGHNPVAIAITPDGATAFVVNSSDGTVTPISTATNTTRTPITISTIFPALFGIVISPDGKTAYVDDAGFAGGITSFDVATGTLVSSPSIEPGIPTWLTFAPNGQYIFGATQELSPQNPAILNSIYVPFFEPGAGDGLIIGSHPTSIAITPDGKHVYTANSGSGTISEFSLSDPDSITTITLGGSPHGVAVSPDGRTLWAADAATGRLIRVSVATGSHASSIEVSTELDAVAIAPDQAPIASISVTPSPHGQPTAFDASASTVRFGSIAKYVWNFGDGKSATTSGPTTTHAYATARSYTATVTETSSAGTSTAIVFTGQTVSRNGGPRARAGKTFTVG